MYFRIRDDNDGSIPYVTFDFNNYNIIMETHGLQVIWVPIIVTSSDDTVYVSCEKYHENIFLFINTLRIGGGLHIFKWDYK